MTVYGTTLVRRSRPESEWIDITGMGDTRPRLVERRRGWEIELWSDWGWSE